MSGETNCFGVKADHGGVARDHLPHDLAIHISREYFLAEVQETVVDVLNGGIRPAYFAVHAGRSCPLCPIRLTCELIDSVLEHFGALSDLGETYGQLVV